MDLVKCWTVVKRQCKEEVKSVRERGVWSKRNSNSRADKPGS